MTEEEAKTKWCPFSRTLDWEPVVTRHGEDPIPVGGAINRNPGNYDRDGNETVVIAGRHRCIGSACMAWRRVDYVDPDTKRQFSDKTGHEIEAMNLNMGFCGLAGKP